MNEAIAPLAASARMTDADYPGVVCQLAPDWRLVVSSDGKRYALQQLGQTDDGPVWVPAGGGRSPGTLAGIVAKFGGRVAGLAALCESLPDDPAQAAPQFVASVHARRAVFIARDMSRDEYARVIRRDENMRLVVSPDGASYVLQLVKVADQDASDGLWQVAHSEPTLSAMQEWFVALIWNCIGPGKAGVLRGPAVLPYWMALCDGLPERAKDAKVAFVPPVP